MRFDFYCEQGSQSFIFTPDDIEKRGLGGAELSLVGLTEALVKLGHSVTVYNQPPNEGTYNGVVYEHTDNFDPYEHREVFVAYRNPLDCPFCADADVRLFWSTDQQTAGNYDTDVFPFVDHTIVISPYHKQYFLDHYYNISAEQITPIDLGVRTEEYLKPVKKVPHRLLYCSVPSRGLSYLAELFQSVRWFIEDAELYITSDFSLWGHGIGAHNEEYRAMFDGIEGVHFLGKVPRQELVELQLSSDILAYPNAPSNQAFPELFGVSIAECQVAGCIPVTSYFGGLQTTVLEQGIFVKDAEGNPLHPSDAEYGENFVNTIVGLLAGDRKALTKRQNEMRYGSFFRFDWKNIAKQWIQTIEKVKANSIA